MICAIGFGLGVVVTLALVLLHRLDGWLRGEIEADLLHPQHRRQEKTG